LAILNGDHPYRAQEAARLYRTGWAREIWLTRVADTPGLTEDVPGAIKVDRGTQSNREFLEQAGVPEKAIRVLPDVIGNTVDELALIADVVRRQSGDRIIVVTSPWHTRRVALTWRRVVGASPRLILQAASDGPYDARRWWINPEGRRLVAHELLGLAYVWARSCLGRTWRRHRALVLSGGGR
jgi:uncharacterized SAM-binding protein YcdF (DUF218 family)